MPGGEPKDGDFVAYLAEIERRQLAALPAPGVQTAPTLTSTHTPRIGHGANAEEPSSLCATEAEQLRARLRQESSGIRSLVGAAFLALFGIFFFVQGALGEGGIIALLIGAFLLWRAAVALRKAASGSAVKREQAARMVDVLRESKKKR